MHLVCFKTFKKVCEKTTTLKTHEKSGHDSGRPQEGHSRVPLHMLFSIPIICSLQCPPLHSFHFSHKCHWFTAAVTSHPRQTLLALFAYCFTLFISSKSFIIIPLLLVLIYYSVFSLTSILLYKQLKSEAMLFYV